LWGQSKEVAKPRAEAVLLTGLSVTQSSGAIGDGVSQLTGRCLVGSGEH
jgi:hypothetical protein